MIKSTSSKGLAEYQAMLNTPNHAGNSSVPKTPQNPLQGVGRGEQEINTPWHVLFLGVFSRKNIEHNIPKAARDQKPHEQTAGMGGLWEVSTELHSASPPHFHWEENIIQGLF